MPRIRATGEGPLLKLLTEELSDWKKATLKLYVERGAVRVNGVVVQRAGHLVRAGDEVELGEHRPSALQGRQVGQRAGLRILFVDDHIIVVEKPVGLLSTSEPPDEHKPSVLSLLERELGRSGEGGHPHAVHRLDRETSGVLLVARSRLARDQLVASWSQTEKTYVAVVEGSPSSPSGTIELPLLEDLRSLDVRVAEGDPRAKETRSHYRVLDRGPRRSLVEVKLDTGHKHQIRVHLCSLGCPIVGDPRYHPRPTRGERLALHAASLAFPQPLRTEVLRFESEVPKVFHSLLRA
ncbi:MAG: RluA family pseudouridine synthase [Myxococcota bacterium]